MSVRYAYLALRSRARCSASVQSTKRLFPDHKRAQSPCTTTLLLQHPTPRQSLVTPAHRRVLSSTSGRSEGGGGDGHAAGVGELPAAGANAEVPGFPWRGAPKLMVQPESFLARLFLGFVFDDSGLRGEDLRVGAEAAFVSAAAAFFKMDPSKVRSPDPLSTDGREDASEEVTSSTASDGEDAVSGDSAEESSKRVLQAIDDRLVAFSSDEGAAVRASGAVPYYRLHQVVAAAVSRKAFIVGAQRGDDISDHLKHMVTPSWMVIVDMENTSAEFEKAVAGHMCVVLQVDVDLACEETFYVTDGEGGKIIQGRKEYVGRIHRIRLESSIGTPESPDPPRWKVIDLDNWLGGNRYW